MGRDAEGVKKVAVVTGASSGIGAAIADRLEDAFSVQRVARRGPVALDVADQPAVARFVDSLERLDVLVCAAGDNIPERRLEQLTPEAWDRLLQVDLSGAFYFLQAALPKLRAAQGDAVFVASVSGLWPDVSGPAYQAAKAGLIALSRAAGLELHGEGVRFTTVNPGVVDTPLLDKRPAPPAAEMRAQMLNPADVAAAVIAVLALPRRAWIPELTILPAQLHALGSTSSAPAR